MPLVESDSITVLRCGREWGKGPDWPYDGPDGWQGGTIEACKLPCNPRMFSEGEAHSSVVLVTSLAWVSTICTALLFVIFHTSSGRELHESTK